MKSALIFAAKVSLLVLSSQLAFGQVSPCIDDFSALIKNQVHVSKVPNAMQDQLPGAIAFEKKRFDFAYKELSILPIKDAQAQYYLGVMTENGLGTKKSPQQALRWYLRAAESGSPQAKFALGRMFSGGSDLPKNYSEAANWFELAAAQGNGDAQLRLSQMYGDGLGKSKDVICAIAWGEIAVDARVDGAHAHQTNILKRATPGEHTKALELKAQLKARIDRN
jgi:TPR repeat protein